MTRNYELDLKDLTECTHDPEIWVTENGEIIGYLCRCGKFHEPKEEET